LIDEFIIDDQSQLGKLARGKSVDISLYLNRVELVRPLPQGVYTAFAPTFWINGFCHLQA